MNTENKNRSKIKINILISIILAFLFWFASPLSLQLGDKLIALLLLVTGFLFPIPMLFVYTFLSVFKARFIYSGAATDPVIYILFPILLRTILDILTGKKIKPHISFKEILWFASFSLIITANIYRVTSLNWDAYSFQKIITFLIQDFSLFFIICLSINNLKTFDKYLKYLVIILITAMFFNFLGVSIEGAAYHGWYFVAKGTPVRAISFGMGLLALFALSLWRTNTNKKMAVFIFVPSIVFMILANERSPVISFLISIVLVFCYDIFIKKTYSMFNQKYLAIIGLFVLAIILITAFFPKHMYSRYSFPLYSIQERVNFLQAGKILSLQSPIIGNGPNSFAITYSGSDIDFSPHNVFLEILAEFGLIGLIPFLGIVAITFQKCWLCCKNNYLNYRAIFLFYAMLYTLIQMCISSQLNGYRWWWVLFGLIFVAHNLLKPNIAAQKN